MNYENKKKKIIVVLGPTAVGKSDLAVRLAKKLNGLNQFKKLVGRISKDVLGEVISADSRQVYRGLNIGTGKITKKEMRGVPHHLLDVASPKQQFSAADFVRLGREKIAAIFSRGKIPIICDGTGFYISALLGEIELPPAPPNPKLRAKLEKKTIAELFAILKKLAPARAAKIDRQNPRRLIRAIEIATTNAVEIRCQHPLLISDFNSAKITKIGLTLPPKRLKGKIRERLVTRIGKGMIAEVKKLHRQGLSWKRMEELGLEYRYLSRFLRGKISKKEMIEKLTTEIWRYSKRQMTWFKRDKNIKWFSPKEKNKIDKQISSLRNL